MSGQTIQIIRSGLDYTKARQRLLQLSATAFSASNAREIDTLREAIDRWECVCGLPGSGANANPAPAKVA